MASVEQTLTQVANLALAHCGVSKALQDIKSDRSLVAQMCRTWIDMARQVAIMDFPWKFATKQVIPSLVANQPTPEWLYAYLYPSDALIISRFISWRLQNDTRQSRIPFTIAQPVPANLSTLTPQPASYSQTTGLWIYTNWPGINGAVGLATILEYRFDNANVAQWDPGFIMALSYRLAVLIVPTITSGDPYANQEKILKLYKEHLDKASAMSLNEEQRPQEPQSEFMRAREGDLLDMPGSTWFAEPAGFVVN